MNTTPWPTLSNPVASAADLHKGRLALCITAFLLTAMPRLSLKFGPVPLYAIDLFIALALYYALKAPANDSGRRPFTLLLVTIGFFACLGELAAAYYSTDVLRPVYALARTLLALSLAYSVARLVQTPADLAALARSLVLGTAITATLMILSSLPATRGTLDATVFSIAWLEPASREISSQLPYYQGSTRGRSLVGVSILSGAFLNAFWPLVALASRLPGTSQLWRRLALLACLLAPFGIVMSYSRGAILGLIMVVGSLLVLGSNKSRTGVLVAFVCALTVFNSIGWDSELFYFDRVVKRTNAVFQDPYDDPREWERINAYSEPFDHLADNPSFAVIGEGTAIGKTGVPSEQGNKATHAIFAMAYYSYGMVAAIAYLLLVIAILRHLLREIMRRRPPGMLAPLYYQALGAGFFGLLSWFVFGHAAISTPRGAMLLFLFIGLVRAMRNVELWEINTHFRHLYR